MKNLKTICITAVFTLLPAIAMASATDNIIRGNAKFNAVAIVLAIIFGGIVFFLFRMDRRLNKLENLKEKQK